MTTGILTLDRNACTECGLCVAVCAYEALVLRPTYLEIIESECVLCDACVIACPTDALSVE
ncbi:MAG TPA: 4Fe-4S binding protein [Acidobacteriota bacterium]|nr:4Fe-4S binding protein [Acidobacteriota bacterium]